jgi:hypothetical protein
MKHITVSVDDETHRGAQSRAAQLGTSVSALLRGYLRSLAREQRDKPNLRVGAELRPRDLDEVIADFDSRGVGLRPEDNLTRDELYDEAINGPDAIR